MAVRHRIIYTVVEQNHISGADWMVDRLRELAHGRISISLNAVGRQSLLHICIVFVPYAALSKIISV